MENTNIWNVYQCTPQPRKLDSNINKKEQQRSLTTVAKLSPSSSSAGLAYFNLN